MTSIVNEGVQNDSSESMHTEIERAWEQLRDRGGDRESLERVLRAIVPTVNFYFSTRE